MKTFIALLMLGVATPAIAQHSGHQMPMPAKPAPKAKPKPAPAPVKKPAPKAKPAPAKPAVKKASPTAKPAPAKATPVDKPAAKPASEPVDHSQMDHGQMDHSQMDGAMAQDQADSMDHSQMDHSQMGESDATAMDHGQMDHSQMDHGAMSAMGAMDMAPTVETPPPAAAGSGPARAADAIWGADAMRASREGLRHENGGQSFAWFQADRAEYRAREDKDGYLWDLQGYYGGDIDKFWLKSEGEGSFGEKPEQAEVQALWSHAITPWFDLQGGVRHDFAGPDRTHAVIGIQGLAPYLFELDAAAFLSTKGDVTARIEGEIDQRITQRLILQPRGEVNLSAQNIPALGIGAGIDSLELGIRLRYEIAREFAPYIGVEQEWKLGRSADYARAAGEDPSVTNYVVGVRFWF